MPLTKKYPEAFEMAWQSYPRWPVGRSIKQLAFKAWKAAAKREGWNDADRRQLVVEIERQQNERASWQRGDKYGPQGMQVWLNQNGWDHDYQTVKGRRAKTLPNGSQTEWEKRALSQAEWEAEQDWLARKSMNMPQNYETAAEAMDAARRRETH